MKNKKMLLIMGIIIIFLDQITKALLVGKNLTIIPNFINITYTENTGIAFGIGSSNILIIIIVSIIVLGIIIKFIKEQRKQMKMKTLVPLILILSGGISNLIDRIIRGYVVDFIDINLFNFPHFNVADISITLGIMALIIVILKSIRNDKEKE